MPSVSSTMPSTSWWPAAVIQVPAEVGTVQGAIDAAVPGDEVSEDRRFGVGSGERRGVTSGSRHHRRTGRRDVRVRGRVPQRQLEPEQRATAGRVEALERTAHGDHQVA